MPKDFILASGSKQRIALLQRIGYEPKKVQPADIDETPKKGERPSVYVKRMALEKALAVAKLNPKEIVLAADTIVIEGGKIILKAADSKEQTEVMQRLSGKSHKVLTAVCVVDKKGKASLKLSTTRIIAKKMSKQEIKEYVDSKNWMGSCGYKIESVEYLVKKIIGSYSGVIGLPLYETKNMLNSAGIK
jgi:septum formation protein